MFEQLSNLTGVGVAGLAVFLMWKLLANHMTHFTAALTNLTEVIKELKEWLQNHK